MAERRAISGSYYASKQGEGKFMKVICSVIFCVFSFCFLYFYQCDMLVIAQYTLSDGIMHYNSLVGGIMITALLMLLQVGVSVILRLDTCWYALCYFPSFLVLSIICGLNPDPDITSPISKGHPLLFILPIIWLCLIYFLRKKERSSWRTSSNSAVADIWKNTLILVIMMFFTGLSASGNAVVRYRARIEQCLLRGDYAKALAVGARSLETDCSLTMLRAYALMCQGELGNSLFSFPINATGDDILPITGNSRCMIFPSDSIWGALNIRPIRGLSTRHTLDIALRRDSVERCVVDYYLCACLLDRDLSAFTSTFSSYYSLYNSVPIHFREALILYNHLYDQQQLVLCNEAELDADFEKYCALKSQQLRYKQSKEVVHRAYSNTYWWYYDN